MPVRDVLPSLPIADPVLIVAIAMIIFLIAPLVAERLRVPGIIGLIVSGAVVGPYGLGILARDATIVLLGTVGLLYLMFVAGLALDLAQFNRQKGRSITFGLLSFFLPQSLGILTGLHLLGFSLASSLLLGSIVGSHTLLAYPVASRLGITRNKGVIMTMGGTIVTDLLALLLLAVVVAASQGTLGAAFWVRFIGLITLYLFAVLKGLPRIGRWFLRTTHGEPNIAFIFLTTALFVTAYLAQLAGLAPIIGAFLAGLFLRERALLVEPALTRGVEVDQDLVVVASGDRLDGGQGSGGHLDEPVGHGGLRVAIGEQGVLGLPDGLFHQRSLGSVRLELQTEPATQGLNRQLSPFLMRRGAGLLVTTGDTFE